MAIRRIGIMGAGAIGSVVGGMLTKAGYDVTFIDQWPPHIEAMKANGLKLSGSCGDHVVQVKALQLFEAQGIQEPFDAAFLAVKAYDTEWATAFIMRYLSEPDGVIVDFQNGINDERVAAVAGRERTLGCVITISAGMYEPGHAMRTDQGGGFKIGELDNEETQRGHELVEIMGSVAESHVTTNLFGDRWSKLAVNSMANPIAGLSRLRLQRGPDAGRPARHRDPGRRRGDPRRPGGRPRDRAADGDRGPEVRGRRRGQERPGRSTTRWRPAPVAWPAAGPRCSRT